jgi:hypothetical protein
MLAHYHGQTWNSSELARAFGVSDTTVRHCLDILTSTYVVRQLPPWHENLAKRQVKAPKVYLCDSGLLHSLLRLNVLSADGKCRPGIEFTARELLRVGVALLGIRIAIVAYPMIVKAMGLDPVDAGVFLGGTIHDVAASRARVIRRVRRR